MKKSNNDCFDYTFAPPHRITLSSHRNCQKTLVDVDYEKIKISWSYHSLLENIPNTWNSPTVDWIVDIMPWIDGVQTKFLAWNRMEEGIPGFIARGESEGLNFCMEGVATPAGDAIRVVISNNTLDIHTVAFTIEHKGGWVISNPAWIDGCNANTLMAMQSEIPDRLLVISLGADKYPINISEEVNNEISVPMAQLTNIQEGNPAKRITAEYCIHPGAIKEGWIIRPYEAYEKDIETLSTINWENEMMDAKSRWIELLNKNMQFVIPDTRVTEALKSCLADIFVMNEQLSKEYFGISCGTEVYRSTNSGEPTIATMVLDQFGYVKEAEENLWVHLDGQDESGNWNDPKGWLHHMWGTSGSKAWMALEHYKLTRDKEFLEKVYPLMKSSTLWQYDMRSKMKKTDSPFYGLMPRGMGDCGLSNNGDFFGVFYPHNCMSVFADALTLEAAIILNKTEDIEVLKKIYLQAKHDLVLSLEKGAVEEDGERWIPGVANQKGGSFWGALFAYYPCGLLEQEHPLIKGTMKRIEKRLSNGGLPLGLGWLHDGCWVAIALDNISSAYLKMGDGDEASKYLYPTLNHATPFYTWCEERGKEPNTTVTSGDKQHLWTPVAVCRYIRDAMIVDKDDSIVIASGTPRSWLDVGKTVGVKNAVTYHGKVDYSVSRLNCEQLQINIKAEKYSEVKFFEVRLRIPENNMTVNSLITRGCKAKCIDGGIVIYPEQEDCFVEALLV